MGVGGQRHAPAASLPEKTPGTHFREGWVQGCSEGVSPPGFDPRTFQSVASSYTNYTIPTYHQNKIKLDRVVRTYISYGRDKIRIQSFGRQSRA
jgi:hypothetical protein